MGWTWGENVKKLDLDILVQNGRRSPGVRPVDGPRGAALLAAAIAEHRPVPSVWEGLQEVVYRDDRPAAWHGASMDDWSIRSHAAALAEWGGPIQTWAGWRDAGTAQGAIERFLLLPNPQRAIIGPWSHGGVAVADPFRPGTQAIDPNPSKQDAIDLEFLDSALGRTATPSKELRYYVMGAGEWRATAIWPPAGTRTRTLYLGSGGTLADTAGAPASDTYCVDFEAGSGRATRWTTNNDGSPVHYDDRTEQDRRLLYYTSDPLPTDTEITGHSAVRLHVGLNQSEGLIIVYLEAVSPESDICYLSEGSLRLLHRKRWTASPFAQLGPQHSFLRADGAPMRKGERALVELSLQPVSVRVPAGHRLRVAIAGADRDTFARIPGEGSSELTVLLGGSEASHITVPIMSAKGARVPAS